MRGRQSTRQGSSPAGLPRRLIPGRAWPFSPVSSGFPGASCPYPGNLETPWLDKGFARCQTLGGYLTYFIPFDLVTIQGKQVSSSLITDETEA